MIITYWVVPITCTSWHHLIWFWHVDNHHFVIGSPQGIHVEVEGRERAPASAEKGRMDSVWLSKVSMSHVLYVLPPPKPQCLRSMNGLEYGHHWEKCPSGYQNCTHSMLNTCFCVYLPLLIGISYLFRTVPHQHHSEYQTSINGPLKSFACSLKI